MANRPANAKMLKFLEPADKLENLDQLAQVYAQTLYLGCIILGLFGRGL